VYRLPDKVYDPEKKKHVVPDIPSGYGETVVSLRYNDCVEFFSKLHGWEKECDRLFKSHDMLTVFYEDFISNPGAHLNVIQTFLGLDVSNNLYTTFIKNRRPPLKDCIQNYNELKEMFSGSEYSVFFED